MRRIGGMWPTDLQDASDDISYSKTESYLLIVVKLKVCNCAWCFCQSHCVSWLFLTQFVMASAYAV